MRIFLFLTAMLIAALDVSSQAMLPAADRIALLDPVAAPRGVVMRSPSLPGVKSMGVIATVSDPSVRERLEQAGMSVTVAGQRFVAGIINADDLGRLDAVEGVESLSLSRRHKPVNDNARAYTFVDEIQSGQELPASYTGEGVVVGLFDIGIDPHHINFLDADGTTRIERLWHYVYDEANDTIIERGYDRLGLADFTVDTLGTSHGTHVLGTITGSYSSTDAGVDLHGMAPGATPVVACGELYDLSILRGIERISDYARSVGKPCVINLSIGDKRGPHDLTEPFAAALDELAGADGTTIALAAGNWGFDSLAVVKYLPGPETQIRTFLSHLGRRNRPDDRGFICEGSLEVWSVDDTPFTVSVEIVDKSDIDNPIYVFTPAIDLISGLTTADFNEQIGDIAVSDPAFDRLFTSSYIAATHELNRANNRYSAAMKMHLSLADGVSPSQYGVLIRVTASDATKVYLYGTEQLDGDLSFTSLGVKGLDAPTVDGTISSLCAGHNSIAVGAYITRQSGYGSISHRALFSGYGVLADGLSRPDICAPGAMIWSSLSGPYRHGPSWTESNTPTVATTTVNGKTYYWTTMEGTSMATPVMTGVAALWLSANPHLTTDDIRRVAAATAVAAPKESMSRPEYWGSGRLNAYEGLKMVLAEQASLLPPPADGDNDIMMTPLGGGAYEIFSVSGISRAELFTISGQLAMTLGADGDTLTIDTSSLRGGQPGIYILRVTTPRGAATFKISLT